MTAPLTRRALQLTAAYGVGVPVLATVIAFAQGPGGWLVFNWFDLIAVGFTVYAIPLTALLWIGWAIFRVRGWNDAIVPFTLFGVVLPLAWYAAALVPGFVEHWWHARQLGEARIESIADEPLLSAQGYPIGVRFTYRVTFPLGLSSLGQEPPADAPAAGLYLPYQKSTLMEFANRASTLRQVSQGGFAAGTTAITIEAVPMFMPLAMQMPSAFAASDPRNLCFRWKNAEDRSRQLAAAPQPVLFEIGPYGRYVPRGSRGSAHAYRLADFYASAQAEGARECP
jgi:hypothetical protein